MRMMLEVRVEKEGTIGALFALFMLCPLVSLIIVLENA